MRILVAPDSFKGSLSAMEVARAMERGVLSVLPDATVIKIPVADGGEGTVETLVEATGGRIQHATVADPLGRPVTAIWGILGDGATAVIEMATASGLPLVSKQERNPLTATSYGTGQLLKAALDQGLRRIIIGLGGSATNDGGAGLAQALGARFQDGAGEALPLGAAALAHLTAIDLDGLDPRLAQSSILVACDVDNPLCGPRGASAVFGPQKGATPAMVQELDRALATFAGIAARTTGKDIARQPGAGAAGGLGAGLLFFTDARLQPGVEIVLAALSFQERMQGVDLVITGEGCTDAQTVMGKAPMGVAKAAAPFKVPVVCLSGGLRPGHEALLEHGVTALMSIVPGPMPLAVCLAEAGRLVQEASARLIRLLLAGQTLGPMAAGQASSISFPRSRR
jgi:glycerate kinase